MVPCFGPLEGSEEWVLGLHRVYPGYIRAPLLRAHAKGPCNYLKRLVPLTGRPGSATPAWTDKDALLAFP